MKHLNLKIHGRVQGVFFRYHTKEQADKLGLRGWVKNNDDETVSINIEGEEKELKIFLDWCYKGPPLAKVRKIEKDWNKKIRGFKSFEIIRGMS